MSPLRPLALFLCALVSALPLRAAHEDDDHLIAEFKARAGNITATAVSDDGQLVLTGEDDGLVTLWSVKTKAPVHNYTGHARAVLAAALLPDGKRGVTCGDDNLVIIWDLATGKRLHQMTTGDSIPLVMSRTPDGSLAATGCDDGQIMIWSLADGSRVATLSHHASLCSLLFSPDAKTLAAGYADGQVILWNTPDWSQRHVLPAADSASVGALSFSEESRILATGNQNGGGFVWNVADGKQLSTFAGYAHPEVAPSPPVAPVFPGSTITPENRSSIVFVCLSPDASMILASIQDEPPRFWEMKTGRFLGTADWFTDRRFYVARYGFTFATAAVTPRRDFLVTTGPGPDNEDLFEVWRLTFTPVPPEK